MEFEKLREILCEHLQCDEDEVTMETSFIDDLGVDSLDLVEIIMAIEDEYDIKIGDDDAKKIVTVADAVEQIKNALN